MLDVVIVGGGINGAALLHEAAGRGLKAALLERSDYGSGSTSRSSRLLHCGLRYLAPGGPVTRIVRRPGELVRAIRAARRGMQARNELHKQRPHLLRPIRMMFPLYRGDDVKGWQVDAAFALLSRFGGPGPGLDYRRYLPGQQKEDLPFATMLPRDRKLVALIAYTEYQIDFPERLCVDLVMEAKALGAMAWNYTPVTGLQRDGNEWRLTARRASGDVIELRSRAVVNLAGPWVDQVAAMAGPAPHRMVATTRGGHVTVQLPEQFRGHGIMTLSGLDHPFYCFPFRNHHFLGPTEAPDESAPDTAHTTSDEIAELLGEARRQLPGLELEAGDVQASWAGMRPLTFDPQTMAAARNRTIHRLPGEGAPLLSLTNGSLGAHRITARDILAELGYAGLPAANVAVDLPLAPDRDPAAIAGSEQVVHLSDLIWRRLGLAWEPGAGLDRADALAAAIAPVLGWDAERSRAEVAEWRRESCALGLALPAGSRQANAAC